MSPGPGPRTLAVTLGDPCGLGPELVVRTLADAPQRFQERGERLLIIGPLAPLVRALEGRHRHLAALCQHQLLRRLQREGSRQTQHGGVAEATPPCCCGGGGGCS